ncbi:MAG: ATP-binding cassette domain-containing protein, partial [Methanomassiliicoccales archaeon]|nr:ATP-binding cassette domain-containing protein [Methanomassiliicoccales archaeon]
MPEQSEPFVTIDNVTKKFNGAAVLRDVSAVIHPGEVLGLIGRSGSGKSVLINMLRGSLDYRPDSGSVVYRVNYCPACGWIDRPIPGEKCKRCGSETNLRDIDFWKLGERDSIRIAMRERIAIMLQRTFALFGDLTVIENVFEALGD